MCTCCNELPLDLHRHLVFLSFLIRYSKTERTLFEVPTVNYHKTCINKRFTHPLNNAVKSVQLSSLHMLDLNVVQLIENSLANVAYYVTITYHLDSSQIMNISAGSRKEGGNADSTSN